jgi:hypothetical protein
MPTAKPEPKPASEALIALDPATMAAGHETDVAVAVHVLRYTGQLDGYMQVLGYDDHWKRVPHTVWSHGDNPGAHARWGNEVFRNDGSGKRFKRPYYATPWFSTYVDCAMRLVDALKARWAEENTPTEYTHWVLTDQGAQGWEARIEEVFSDGFLSARTTIGSASAATLPLAVCRAAIEYAQRVAVQDARMALMAQAEGTEGDDDAA